MKIHINNVLTDVEQHVGSETFTIVDTGEIVKLAQVLGTHDWKIVEIVKAVKVPEVEVETANVEIETEETEKTKKKKK